MKVFGNSVRLLIPVCLFLLMLCASVPAAYAQVSLSASPSSLSFGIPTGTSPAVSAPQTVTVNITGSGTVTFIGASIVAAVTNTGTFNITGNSCQGTLTAPTTCQVTVTLTDTSTSLQSATLHIRATGFDDVTVGLTGAFGAIKLFDQTTVAPSHALVNGNPIGFNNEYTIATQGLNLSCPADHMAKLSGTPDGLGFVLVDNYVTLAIGGSPVSNGGSPAGNVCTGGVTDSFNNTTQQDCFSQAYRTAASPPNSLNGDSTDSLTNPGNGVLPGGAAGGVSPIDISSFFAMDAAAPFPVNASVTLLDAGGFVASSTLFLVTDCTLAGITPGGTITGNPITGNTASQTQTFLFDTAPGQNIGFTSSESVAIQQGTITAPNGVVPILKNFGIPQSTFSQLVTGTSAAPAVCLRLTGEVDPVTKQTLCKGFQIQCFDPNTNTTTGDNCVPTASSARNLFDSAQFSSPDAPAPTSTDPSQNYLSPAATVNACGNIGAGVVCAPGTGPGILLGGDNWLNTPFSTSNCTLTGTLLNDFCPLDTLTQFKGALDPGHGGTTLGRNSIYVPVVNKPLPSTQASIAGHADAWVNSSSVTANFISNAATYSGGNTNPPSNNFVAAPPYSVTFGISNFPNVPDTTFPVSGDTTNYNAGVAPNLKAPVCSPAPAASFASNGMFNGLADGLYNLHYFTTDCAFTEELLFNPQGNQLTDPTANWASFKVLTFGVDTAVPTIALAAGSPAQGSAFTIGQNVAVTFSCNDVGSGLGMCAGKNLACPNAPTAGALATATAVQINTAASQFGPQNINVSATDCAGNPSAPLVYNYNIVASPADVAIGEVETSDRVKRGSNVTYLAFVVDQSATIAYGVNFTSSFMNLPAGATISASVQTLSCTLQGCTLTNTPCTVSGSVSCSIGQLQSLSKGTVATVKLVISVPGSATPGPFTINSVVTSDNDPNPNNNSTTETIQVTN